MKTIYKRIATVALSLLIMVCGISVPTVSAVSKLARPQSVSVKLVSTKKAKISWKRVSGAKKYQVYYSTGGSYKKLKTTSSKSVSHSGLKAGKTYRYKVKAVRGSKKSSYSSVEKQKTLGNNKIKVKTKVSGVKVTVRWNSVKNASGYYLYRKSSGGSYKKLADTKDRIFKDTSLTSLGKKYVYKVVPYIKDSGKKIKGAAGKKTATTAKSAYLLDIMEPYEKPYYYDTMNFVMGGDSYGHGYSCMGYGDEGFGNVTSFNLKGKFSKLTFDAGILDNDGYKNNANIYIYADGELIEDFVIDPNNLPKHYKVNVEDCIQLRICVYSHRSVAMWDSSYGIANIKVYK